MLILVLAYVGASNTFFHSAAVAGTPLKIKTQLGDDGRSLPLVDRAAHQADRWLRDEFGHRISEPTNIRLARSGNCVYVENLIVVTQDSTGWQGTGGICLYTQRSQWKAMLAGDDGRDAEEFVIHELIHSAQTELGCVDDSRESRFRWLMEGMAVYGAREAQISSGRRRAQETDPYIREAGGYSPDLDPLERFETAEGDSAAYQLWHRAVRRLAVYRRDRLTRTNKAAEEASRSQPHDLTRQEVARQETGHPHAPRPQPPSWRPLRPSPPEA